MTPKKGESEEDKAVTLLRKRFVRLVTDLHDRNARPLMNARQMLTLYIEQFGPALTPQKRALLQSISDELDKAVADYKRIQQEHQRE